MVHGGRSYKWIRDIKSIVGEPLPANTIDRSGAALSFRIFPSIQEMRETTRERSRLVQGKNLTAGARRRGTSAEEAKIRARPLRAKFGTDVAAPDIGGKHARLLNVDRRTGIGPIRG